MVYLTCHTIQTLSKKPYKPNTMPKNQPLLFILLLASTFTLQARTKSWSDQLAHIKIKKEEIPTRVRNILNNPQNKFTKIEHYYPWQAPLPLSSLGFFGCLLPGFLAMVYTAKVFFEKTSKMEINTFLFIETAIGSIMSIIIWLLNKYEYETHNKESGCFCLTNTGLLIIPAKKQPLTWLAYENIESVKEMFFMLQEPRDPDGFKQLTIQLKIGGKNRDCSNSNMGAENYKNLLKYLADKLKPYGKQIKTYTCAGGKEIPITKHENKSPFTDKSVQESQKPEPPH